MKAKKIFKDAPYARQQEFDRLLNMYGKDFGIVTKSDLAAFYATLLAEVGTAAKIKTENLNYSASSLKKVFKVFKQNPELAERYGRTKTHKANQIMIANLAYGNRMGNGDVESEDGWNFRGRGFIQLTGKRNYEAVTEVIKETIGVDFMLDTFPEIVGTDTGAVISALGFWKLNNLQGKTIDQVTDKVNYYTESRGKRRRYYNQIMDMLG